MSTTSPFNLNQVTPDDFDVRTLDDEIRVDQLCAQLLQAVRTKLLDLGHPPHEAGDICRGADHFLRDFVIAECHDNLFRLPGERVRQFAGHWYIVRTLEPNSAELATLLSGIAACYHILADHGLVAPALAEAIGTACSDLPFYNQRIDDFWAIEDNGFDYWRNGCPLPKPRP